VLDLKTLKHRILVRGVAARYAAPGYLVFIRADGSLAAAAFDQDKLTLTGDPIPIATGLGVGPFGVVDFALGADGTLAYLTGGASADASEVVWVSREGKASPVHAGWRADFTTVSLSPDGTRLAVGIAAPSGEEDIWVKQLDSGPLSRLTFGGPRSRSPTWTPDSRRVVFVSDAKVPFSLVSKRADGNGSVEPVAHEVRSIAEGVFSRDGRFVLYRTSSSDSGNGDILAMRVSDSTTLPLVTTRWGERHPALSPDGRWVSYTSVESGTAQVYVRPFPNTDEGKWQVSTNGGSDPVWAHSGTELFYVNAANEMIAAAIVTQPTFSAQSQRTLFALPPDVRQNPSRPLYDVSPDDRRFIMAREAGADGGHVSPPRLVVVSNFFEELKAKVPRK